MSIIGMMLRWRMSSPSGTRSTALRMMRARFALRERRSLEPRREQDVVEQRHRLRVVRARASVS